MGSYCGIHFDKLSICESKSEVPGDWAALFQERDRRETRPTQEVGADPDLCVEYAASRDVILRRLSILGATDEAVQRAFETWLTEEQEQWRDNTEGWSDREAMSEHAAKMLKGLNGLTYQEWCRFASGALRIANYDRIQSDFASDPFRKQFHELDDGYLWFAGYGSHLGLRALLDAVSDIKEVRLDISDLLGEYVDEHEPICSRARENAPCQLQMLAPTMVMAEGSSDLTALRLGLGAMHPDLMDYFSFFNHAELSVDGGANYLVKFLKAIAAARSTSRILAIFDNDTAGIQAYELARALKLPFNIIVTRYPDSDVAKAYPTVGPSGPAILDVNGQAAGIELYMGREALLSNGELRPVRWAGYVASAGKYQGEVDGKGQVLEAFRKNIATVEGPEAARASFPDLERVWQHNFDLVQENSGLAYLRTVKRLAEV
ncbi:HEPN/Toprim-associated domain-containing protein [Gluconobacter sp. GP1]|uniref:HEPN/Toprim-associated domain-containing protein n=1 Tax=Gluconobacter sp. GP1 TaxID=3046423 RepID=UPI00293E0FD4|nr:HEPN/Toprim-associated domain-containing protein [Gluconobacter sp. GP1]